MNDVVVLLNSGVLVHLYMVIAFHSSKAHHWVLICIVLYYNLTTNNLQLTAHFDKYV